jgi:hypothetical protein
MEAGLVEHAPHILLPVQLVRNAYRLTAAGEVVLHGRRHTCVHTARRPG